MSSRNQDNRKKNNSVIIAVVVVLLIILAAGVFFVRKIQSRSVPAELIPSPTPAVEPTPVQPTPEPTMSPEEIKALEEARIAAEEAQKAEEQRRREEAAQYSFYQKLGKGYDVNILVLGDSTAMENNGDPITGTVNGKRFSDLAEQLKGKYYSGGEGTVTVTNYAHAYGNLLSDALQINRMGDDVSYDLAILCYGLNDENKDVLQNYEALVLTLREKFPDCSMICTLEPGFHMITPQLETMRTVSETYNIPVVDLFSTFYDRGREEYFGFFDRDQTHLSDIGQQEWEKLLIDVIDENVAADTGKMADVTPITKNAVSLSHMTFIPADDSRVERIDDSSYSLDYKTKGFVYLLHPDRLEKSEAKIVADDILYSLGKPTTLRAPDGSFITFVFEELVCKNDFTLTFADKALADDFEGFYIQVVDEAEIK